VVLDAGHCPHDEVPELVNAALLKWIAALPATATAPATAAFSTAAAPPAADLAPVAASGRTGA
jgi:hypothetical protein